MAEEHNKTIIACGCGQRMKVPAEAHAKKFKCVRCGKLLTRAAAPETAGEKSAEMPDADEPVGQLLVEAGMVSVDQLAEALACQQTQGGRTFEILIGLGYLKKEDLHSFLSRQPGVAALDLSRCEIDRALLPLVPRELALDALILPIDRLGKLLTVAMACPLDTATIRALEEETGLRVRAMLCQLDDIHSAVDRYYPEAGEAKGQHIFQLPPEMGLADRDDVGQRVAGIETIPLDGEVAKSFEELRGDDASTLRRCLDLAIQDPGAAITLLRTANSAGYGLPGQVGSLEMAVSLLGTAGCREAAGRAGRRDTSYDLGALCDRAQRCAEIAGAVARASGRIDPGLAATGGLLHELGRFVLACLAPQRYLQVSPACAGQQAADEELRHFTMAHPELGARLVARWRLPKPLQQAIRHYLRPDSAGDARDLASVIAVVSAALAEGGVGEESLPHLEYLGVGREVLESGLNAAASN